MRLPGTVIIHKNDDSARNKAKFIANICGQNYPGQMQNEIECNNPQKGETPQMARLRWFRSALHQLADECTAGVRRHNADGEWIKHPWSGFDQRFEKIKTIAIPYGIGCAIAGGEQAFYDYAINEFAERLLNIDPTIKIYLVHFDNSKEIDFIDRPMQTNDQSNAQRIEATGNHLVPINQASLPAGHGNTELYINATHHREKPREVLPINYPEHRCHSYKLIPAWNPNELQEQHLSTVPHHQVGHGNVTRHQNKDLMDEEHYIRNGTRTMDRSEVGQILWRDNPRFAQSAERTVEIIHAIARPLYNARTEEGIEIANTAAAHGSQLTEDAINSHHLNNELDEEGNLKSAPTPLRGSGNIGKEPLHHDNHEREIRHNCNHPRAITRNHYRNVHQGRTQGNGKH
jgi:hypothetical protein